MASEQPHPTTTVTHVNHQGSPYQAHHAAHEAHAEALPQITLEETAVDACSRKRHAVSRGYFADPYLKYFTRDSTYINSPLMNRGYWLRVRAVESAINRFVALLPGDAKFQVVSLGAGFDSLFFRWAGLATAADPEAAAVPPTSTDTQATTHEAVEFALSDHSTAGAALRSGRLHRFVEVDQVEVMVGKARVVRQHQDLSALATMHTGRAYTTPLVDVTEPSTADVLRYVGGNLVDAQALSAGLFAHEPPHMGPGPHEITILDKGAKGPLLDASLPTIIIAECVLVYMDAKDSYNLLESITNMLSGPVAVLSYDAIQPTTPFGKQMVDSLAERGLQLRGINDLPTTNAHQQRYEQLGYQSVKSWSMKTLWTHVPVGVQKRINHIEMQDDYDEWCLVQEHYSMTWALRRPINEHREGADAIAIPAEPPKLFF
jgi:O-methyltransferase involved in polyketide biosynthesis